MPSSDEARPGTERGSPREGARPSAADPMIGTVVAGRYRVDARVGEGGMGTVYRVEHTLMRKRLALKVLHHEMTGQTEMVARFEREAMAAAHIDHPNIAGATDFGKLDDGTFYLVLEYVEGVSLRKLIDFGPLAPARAVRIVLQMLSALRRAHELGIVHRDLKPENILLVEKDGDPDFVKILDFGIARVPIGALGGGSEDAGPTLTRAGMVYGTPEYMAPEQALGQDVDGRSDLYSVGVIIFELLTGRRPYDHKDKVALLGQHVAGAIPSLCEKNPQLAEGPTLEPVVTRMLAKIPAERFQDAGAVIEALLALELEGVRPGMRGTGYRETSSMHGLSGRSGQWSADPSSPVVAEPSAQIRVVPAPVAEAPRLDDAPRSAPLDRWRRILHQRTSAWWTLVRDEATRRGLPAWSPMVAAAGLLCLVVVLVSLAAARTRRPLPVGPAPEPSASVEEPAVVVDAGSATPTVPNDVRAKTQAALGRMAMGEVSEGVSALEDLASKHPTDPFVLRSLAQAYAQSRRYEDALAVIKRLLPLAPEVAAEPFFSELIEQALGVPSAVDAVFSVLETSKVDGGRTLYDLAYPSPSSRTRVLQAISTRARRSLGDPEVRQNVAPPIRAALDLRAAPYQCAARRELLERYRDAFDVRSLPVLQPMQKTTGCGGFFKKDDCWPCLREDRLLDRIVANIEERARMRDTTPVDAGGND